MNIPDFIARCDQFCAAHGKTRVWLSKALLADTYRLDKLAAGEVDIGVKRLEQADSDLTALDADLVAKAEAQRGQGVAA